MYSHVPVLYRRWRIQASDALVLGIVGLFIYGLVATARLWQSSFVAEAPISLSLGALPLYSLYSLIRALLAYVLSLVFTLVFGYLAAKNRAAERVIVPMLDIGQSIPVLGFLPALVLSLVALFPRSNVGIELACVIMIFTGQVWNMTFSYISSLKAVPEQLYEMSRNVGLSRWRQLARVELPCAATGLAWNSLMSMAGGWFFLTVCESFTLGSKSFQVPGLGSYMALAIAQGDATAMTLAIVAMIGVILFTDFVIWRPIIAWTARYRLTESAEEWSELPFMTLLLRESPFFKNVGKTVGKLLHGWTVRRKVARASRPAETGRARRSHRERIDGEKRAKRLEKLIMLGWVLILAFAAHRLFGLLSPLRWAAWRDILLGTLWTGLRVIGSIVIATAWTVPAAIWIGLSPRLTRLFQPIVQVAASFPAPMLYPLALAVFAALHFGLAVSSGLLMLLGVQWYVLFNVLAGAVGISQDLRESFRLIGVSRAYLWRHLYLPSVFPALVTGWVTAAGGAWNASIVAEYINYRGDTLSTWGLGSKISQATSSGDFPQLAACLVVMVVVVVAVNRGFWSRLYELAESRYRFER